MSNIAKSAAEPTSKREAGKADRRKRIVEAARELIKETGDLGLSMRALAEKAQVSIATPYNLFGSKREIVLALTEDVKSFQKQFDAHNARGGIDKTFSALSIILKYIRDEPDLYRAIWTAILDAKASEQLRAELIPPQANQFWNGLLQEAVDDGDLEPSIDLHALQNTMGSVFAGTMLKWVMGNCGVEEIEPAIGFGYTAAFSAAATGKSAEKLRQKMLEFQKELNSIGRAG